MRRIGQLLAIVLLLFVGGPRSASRTAVYAEPIVIRASPVLIAADDPRRTRVGALRLVAGWRLTSASPQFGGWSALDVQPVDGGARITAIGDAGSVLRFRLGQFGHASGARIDPLPPGCGASANKYDRDAESLARIGDGDWLVGFEWHNALCRMTHDFAQSIRLRRPPEMRRWPRTRGPETIMRLADGRILVLAEGNGDDGGLRQLLIYRNDPTLPREKPVSLWYRPPEGFNPTDAAQLRDGRILIMNRRFSVFSLFTGIMTAIDAREIREGAVLTPRPIAQFAPPVLSDNYEGLSVTVEGGQPYVWMISDDNFISWQSTYLLKFAIDR